MEAIFRNLCDIHGLTNIGTNYQPGHDYVTVYLHWGEDGCASGLGRTFDAALTEALLAKASPVDVALSGRAAA